MATWWMKPGRRDVEDVQLTLRRLGHDVPREEIEARAFGEGTHAAISDLQRRFGLAPTGELDGATEAAMDAHLAAVEAGRPVVEGRIYLEDGRPAANMPLRVYALGFGGEETMLGEGTTDGAGFYAVPYGESDPASSVVVRAVGPRNQEVPLSEPKFGPAEEEVINLVAPAELQPLAAEFERLAGDLEAEVGALDKLGGAEEGGDRKDLTLLREKTGWDARLIGLAATATRLSAETGVPASALYALFRTGLPANAEQLATLSAEVVGRALRKAQSAGVVALTKADLAAAKESFSDFAREARKEARAPGAASTYGELLEKSGLNASEREAFAELYFEYGGEPTQLWKKAAESLPQAKIEALQLQGKLGYLTLNNASLAEELQSEIGSPANLGELVDKDLHTSDAWEDRIKELAADGDLEALVPPAYAGGTAQERLSAYAEDLARKVRLSFPTRSVARLVETDDMTLGDDHDELKGPVTDFLRKADGLGFALGRVPLGRFVEDHSEELLGDDLSGEDKGKVLEGVKTLQRTYQITPDDETMKTALALGFSSAQDIVAFEREEWHRKYGKHFGSREKAELVYRKAEQVASVTYSFFAAAKQLQTNAPVFGATGAHEDQTAALDRVIKQYPTLESLFGSLDFCECEHCRSVLSPAAYLVDLLQFINPEELVWDGFLADWKTRRGKEYEDEGFLKPFDALVQRRPDLQHIPLTCENTNTAMPYIDVALEILECFVDNGAVDEECAYDTGSATTEELLAEPQNTKPGAYAKLQQATYPVGLPFHLWIETVRAFFEHAETPLWTALETFRPTDELFKTQGGTEAYDRAAVFIEQLGLTPPEHDLVAGRQPTGGNWPELYGYASAAAASALSELKSARRLSRRLGVSYRQLIDLVKSGFVNPELDKLVVLRKLGIEPADVFRYKGAAGHKPLTTEEKDAFEKRLDDFEKAHPGFDATAWLDQAWQNQDFDRILVLADPDAGCNFDETTLRYADGSAADAIVFIKLNLLVRLWRRLGWTIGEIDRALQAFVPEQSVPLTTGNFGEALETALVYMAHLGALNNRVKLGRGSLLKLLPVWSNLPTTGTNPLYAQLFLTPGVLKLDPDFDDPLGNYLEQGEALKDHLLALQGALNLTAADIEAILADAGSSIGAAQLHLDTVSLLYRHGVLARGLSLSVPELISLKALTGLDPFESLEQGPLTDIDDDHPFQRTLRFVEIVERLRELDLQVEELDYLLRHDFDPVGEFAPDPQAVVALARGLAAEIKRIRAEHAVPDDAGTLTDDVLAQKLPLALPAEVATTFLAMWAGTVVYEAVEDNVAAGLDPGDFSEPEITVTYDDVQQVQRLAYRGVLLPARKAQLTAAHPGQLVSDLLDEIERQPREFFENHLLDFLTAADYEPLFAPLAPNLSNANKQNKLREKREKLAKAFLPYLQERLIRRTVVDTLAASLASEPAFTESLVTDLELLKDPSEATAAPLLGAFAGVGEPGVSASFYTSADGTGNPSRTATVREVDTAGRPASADSASFAGFLEVPESGVYRLHAQMDKQHAEVELHFDHLPDPLLRDKAQTNNSEVSDAIELKAGVPYGFSFYARKLGGGKVRLLVRAAGLAKGSLGRLTLYPRAAVERLRRARLLLAKALHVVGRLQLSERELRHLVTHPADFDGLELSELPTSEEDTPPGTDLFRRFMRALDYARLKRKLAADRDDLVQIFQRARRVLPSAVGATAAEKEVFDDVCGRFAALVRREPETVQAAAEALGFAAVSQVVGGNREAQAPAFADERGLWRLWDALYLAGRLGVPPDAVAGWTKIVGAAPAAAMAIARDVRNTIKARHQPEAWQRTAQQVFDGLRRKQRDALVAHVMQSEGYERSDQLFEHFLIDPGMEPVVQTSRIQLAIASVQLFVQRCLLNLEPKVHPSALQSPHGEWMKRYRVWEANRKVFLFPENLLEPEFRDDKSHLFQELESALLEGDVSLELAETAFARYLQGLEEVARLEVVTMYCDERPDPSSNVLHVIGRSQSAPRKYFYRRYAHQSWTPWEPVGVDIEGDHVAAVVWRGRLHLFWVTFFERGSGSTHDQSTVKAVAEETVGTATQKQVDAQLNWTELFEGEWTPRRSSGFGIVSFPIGSASFDASLQSIWITKEYDPETGDDAALKVNVGSRDSAAFRIVSKLTPPARAEGDPPPDIAYNVRGVRATQRLGVRSLVVTWPAKVTTEDASGKQVVETKSDAQSILDDTGRFLVLFPSKQLELAAARKELDRAAIAAVVTPFFYADDASGSGLEANTFFVEPALTEKTTEIWEEWVITTRHPADREEFLEELEIVPFIPEAATVPLPIGPGPVEEIPATSPVAVFEVEVKDDWLTNPGTVLEFGDALVGKEGGLKLELKSAEEGIDGAGPVIEVRPGSELETGAVLVAPDGAPTGGVTVVGDGGLNPVVVGGIGFGGELFERTGGGR